MRPAGGPVDAGDEVEERRLARAALAEKGDDFAGPDLEVHAPQGGRPVSAASPAYRFQRPAARTIGWSRGGHGDAPRAGYLISLFFILRMPNYEGDRPETDDDTPS